jgi:hypothetical protein
MYNIEFINKDACCIKTKQKHCCRYKKVKFVHDTFSSVSYPWIEEECYTFKKTSKKSSNKDKNIVILHIKNKK